MYWDDKKREIFWNLFFNGLYSGYFPDVRKDSTVQGDLKFRPSEKIFLNQAFEEF